MSSLEGYGNWKAFQCSARAYSVAQLVWKLPVVRRRKRTGRVRNHLHVDGKTGPYRFFDHGRKGSVMASCALFNGSGQLVEFPISEISKCTGVVLMSAAEYVDVMSSRSLITNSADAGSIATAFIGLLAIAFCYRALSQVITQSYEGNSNETH